LEMPGTPSSPSMLSPDKRAKIQRHGLSVEAERRKEASVYEERIEYIDAQRGSVRGSPVVRRRLKAELGRIRTE